jgi:hypothetical protein
MSANPLNTISKTQAQLVDDIEMKNDLQTFTTK